MGDLGVSDTDMLRELNRASLRQLWDDLMAGRVKEAAQAYLDQAVLRFPQSGEKIAGRTQIAARGLLEPGEALVKVNRILGDGGLWLSECETLQHRRTMLLVSIAEMQDGKICSEIRYRMPKHVGLQRATDPQSRQP